MVIHAFYFYVCKESGNQIEQNIFVEEIKIEQKYLLQETKIVQCLYIIVQCLYVNARKTNVHFDF